MARELGVVELAAGVYGLIAGVNCAIIEAPDKTAVLVDSGQDADYGKGVRRALTGLGLTPTAIICTHSHADHYGGNAYLLKQFPDVEVIAPQVEANIIRSPELEPIYLFHGAAPLPELQSKWLKAPASPVHREVEAGAHTVGGVPLELIDVRGHSHRQLAVRVADVLLAADAVFGSETLTRYPLPFGQDIAGQLTAHETVASVDARVLLPGHGAPTGDIDTIVEENRRAVTRAADAVADAVLSVRGGGTEDVLAACGGTLGLEMNDFARYHLNYCTISAYLGYLRAAGRITADLTGGRLSWRSAA
ncbi:MAG TPA: MBL fold metallo-hydrolase [Trueperaceae bacterium]|nr:MBL fold metallo-hydrolase [Trueperaceae bacterium]